MEFFIARTPIWDKYEHSIPSQYLEKYDLQSLIFVLHLVD